MMDGVTVCNVNSMMSALLFTVRSLNYVSELQLVNATQPNLSHCCIQLTKLQVDRLSTWTNIWAKIQHLLLWF